MAAQQQQSALIFYTGSLSSVYCYKEIWQRASDIGRLPVELLARVLQHLHSYDDMLGSAALVSKAWHKAAVMAVDSIHIDYCPAAKCSALSAWLQAHGHLAAVSSLYVHRAEDPEDLDDAPDTGRLQLPTPQLRDLKKLSLFDLKVTAAPDSSASNTQASTSSSSAVPVSAADSQPSAAVLSSELAALTGLKLYGCHMSLAGLETLTGLQSLSCGCLASPDGQAASAVAELAQALPQLQHLTKLTLADMADCEGVLSGVGSCTRLVRLKLLRDTCSTEGLQQLQLPPTLEHLALYFPTRENTNNPPNVRLGASTAPQLLQLSALQSLSVTGVAAFDTAVLEGLSSLTYLWVQSEQLAAAPGQYRFQPLATQKLPELLELRLCAGDSSSEWSWTQQEAAALTASASVTSLRLEGTLCFICKPAYMAMFPADRTLNMLRRLELGISLLGSIEATAHMVQCCANVTSLELSSRLDWELEAEPGALAGSITCLQRHWSLRQLTIMDRGLQLCAASYKALAGLWQLTSLSLVVEQNHTLDQLLQLTSCRALESLHVTYWVPANDDAGTFEFGQSVFMYQSQPHFKALLPRKLAEAADSHARQYNTLDALHCCLRTVKAVAALEVEQQVSAVRSELLGQLRKQSKTVDLHLKARQSGDGFAWYWKQRTFELTDAVAGCRKRLADQERDYQVQLGAMSRKLRASQQQVTDLKQRVDQLLPLQQEVQQLKQEVQQLRQQPAQEGVSAEPQLQRLVAAQQQELAGLKAAVQELLGRQL